MVDYRNAVYDGTGTAPFTSWLFPPDNTSKYILVPCTKMWTWRDPVTLEEHEFPALVTAGEITADPLYGPRNVNPAQSAISGAQVQGEIPFWPLTNPVTFLDLPALYLGDTAVSGTRWALALVPGMVNMQVWKTPLQTSLWLPKPYGPRQTLGALRVDVFQSAADQVLENGRNIVFIDVWDTYHRFDGEVHCGTNVIRTVSAEFSQWWSIQP